MDNEPRTFQIPLDRFDRVSSEAAKSQVRSGVAQQAVAVQ